MGDGEGGGAGSGEDGGRVEVGMGGWWVVSEDRVVAVVRDEKRAVVGDAKGHWIGSRNLHSERPHCGSWW